VPHALSHDEVDGTVGGASAIARTVDLAKFVGDPISSRVLFSPSSRTKSDRKGHAFL
jgi:hypothetical protein